MLIVRYAHPLWTALVLILALLWVGWPGPVLVLLASLDWRSPTTED